VFAAPHAPQLPRVNSTRPRYSAMRLLPTRSLSFEPPAFLGWPRLASPWTGAGKVATVSTFLSRLSSTRCSARITRRYTGTRLMILLSFGVFASSLSESFVCGLALRCSASLLLHFVWFRSAVSENGSTLSSWHSLIRWECHEDPISLSEGGLALLESGSELFLVALLD